MVEVHNLQCVREPGLKFWIAPRMVLPVRRHVANGRRKARDQQGDKATEETMALSNSFNISFNYSSKDPMIHCTALATEIEKTARNNCCACPTSILRTGEP